MGPYGPQPGPGPNPDWAPTRARAYLMLSVVPRNCKNAAILLVMIIEFAQGLASTLDHKEEPRKSEPHAQLVAQGDATK